MPSDDTGRTMEWDTAQRILRVGMVISFLVAALGIVGELLGWWNDVGELLTTTGTIGGLVLGATSIVGNASRTQVESVATTLEGVDDGVDQANETLETIDEDLDKLDKLDKLDEIDAGLDRQTDLLAQIRDRL